MLQVTIQFPYTQSNGDRLTEQDVREWFASMSRAMVSFTGIQVKLIKITDIGSEGNG